MTFSNFLAGLIVGMVFLVGLRLWWATKKYCSECRMLMRMAGRDVDLIRLSCAKCRELGRRNEVQKIF